LELLTGLWNWEFNYLNGFPFSTYGETVFIAVQNVALILLLWAYASKEDAPGVLEYIVAIVGIAGAGAAPLYLPVEYLPYVYTAQLVLFSIARFPQMLANFQAGHTGSSSGITLFMNFAGTLARVFTSMQEVKSPLVLVNFIVNASINAVLFAQFVMYRTATRKHLSVLAKEHSAKQDSKVAKKAQ
jgi:mannose-P-dolichol utilization defect protein 1